MICHDRNCDQEATKNLTIAGTQYQYCADHYTRLTDGAETWNPDNMRDDRNYSALAAENAMLHQRINDGEQLMNEGIALVDRLSDTIINMLNKGEWTITHPGNKLQFTIDLSKDEYQNLQNILESI